MDITDIILLSVIVSCLLALTLIGLEDWLFHHTDTTEDSDYGLD